MILICNINRQQIIVKQMPKQTQKIKQIKKDYWNRIQEVVYKYKNVLFVNADNVSSLQAAKLRAKLRLAGLKREAQHPKAHAMAQVSDATVLLFVCAQT